MSEKQIAVIDAETDPFERGKLDIEPFIWGYYDGKDYKEFTDTKDLIAFIETVDKIVYAHNGGKFDFHFMIEYIERHKPILVINGRLSKFKIGKAELRDSYNILPVPLANLKKDQFDYNLMKIGERNKPENWSKIKEYLKHDCEYLFEHINKFISSYGNYITLASTAFKQWEGMGNIAPKSTQNYYNTIKPFYYGGRVTPFSCGVFKGDFKIIDINSAYPTAMSKAFHPLGTQYFETAKPKDSHLPYAFLDIECYSKNALPFRTKKGLSFPEGRGNFTITGWEFIAGLETKTIKDVKINNALVFTKLDSFKQYVKYFHNKKQQADITGDKAERQFAKLFLNSLYGKFGINRANFEEYYLGEYGERPKEQWICPECLTIYKEDIEHCHECQIALEYDGFNPDEIIGDLQLFSKPYRPKTWDFINLATAASITGWVRAFLWKSINQVDTPYYCDTDSIICKDIGKLKLGKELGQWALEGEADKLAIAGKKLYAAHLKPAYIKGGKEYKLASKGVKLTGPEIEKVALGGTVEYENISPTFTIKKERYFCNRKVKKTFDNSENFI